MRARGQFRPTAAVDPMATCRAHGAAWVKSSDCRRIPSTAILDRLLHHAHVINIKGRSYRLQDLEEPSA